MPTLEQAVDARLTEFREMAESGTTELTGKARREAGHEGEVIARYGGLKPMYPELQAIPDSPKAIAAAIRRGEGKVYNRVYRAVEAAMVRKGFEPGRVKSKGRPTEPPHVGRQYCKHCRDFHTKGQHRSHGAGSFHRTHLFAFNPPMTVAKAKVIFATHMQAARKRKLARYEQAQLRQASQVLRRSRQPAMNPKKRNCPNPRQGVTKIYGKVLRIEAQKTGKHWCDAECKKCGHRYYHDFRVKPTMYGLPDGSILIKG